MGIPISWTGCSRQRWAFQQRSIRHSGMGLYRYRPAPRFFRVHLARTQLEQSRD